jgi:protein gp37
MQNSAINWTDHTFNPWEGCTKCSPGCKNCYAEAINKRCLREKINNWGKGAPRKQQSAQYWEQPLAWDRKAAKAGVRPRVFCASTADWADDEAPAGVREKLFELIKQTPNLDWLLLTKRATNIEKYLPKDWDKGYPNVWLGVSVENKTNGLPRIDTLREIPAVCRFLSCEPLLEDLGKVDLTGIHWVIVGGETGKKDVRSMNVGWAQSLIRQCKEQKVAPWFKQLGKLPLDLKGESLFVMNDRKRSPNGENWDAWPEELAHLRVREIPHFSQTDPAAVEASLVELAKGLDGERAAKELQLRAKLLAVDGQLFLKRAEKASIVKGYYDLYLPLKKWSAFCRAVNLPRRTGYDLLEAERGAEAMRAKSAQSGKKEKPKITPQVVAEMVNKTVSRLLKGLSPENRHEAIKLIRDVIDAESKAPKEGGEMALHVVKKDTAPLVPMAA